MTKINLNKLIVDKTKLPLSFLFWDKKPIKPPPNFKKSERANTSFNFNKVFYKSMTRF